MSLEVRRMAVAVLALAGVFLSLYLLLYKLGVYGELVCGAGGSCDVVQASRYAVFLGFPVAGWGVAWYAAVFGVSTGASVGPWSDRRWAGPLLLGLAAGGLAFSAYLTWIELFVLQAICRWCVASAALTVLIFGLALPWGRRGAGDGS